MEMSIIKGINLGLSFVLELGMLAAFAVWGIHTGQNLATKILFGAGAPILAAVFWGFFMAPRSSMRVGNPLYMIFKVILFTLAVIALVAAGRSSLAWVLGIGFTVNSLIDLLP